MRIASFVFLGLVLALLANLAVSAAYPPYREFVRGFRTTLVPGYVSPKAETPLASTNTPGISASSDQEIAESLSRVNAGLDALIASSGTGNTSNGAIASSGAITKSGSTVKTPEGTGSITAPVKTPQDSSIPVSGLLLARLMPDIMPKKIENKGIFGIHIFSTIAYTTYQDDKTKIRLYAFGETYSVMLSNLKLVANVYTVNETDTFFDSTFFLNATSKKDTTIRFVTELEGRAIGVEAPKSAYAKLKKLLLKK